MHIEPAYKEKVFGSYPLCSVGSVDTSESILLTYVDLDWLIEHTKLSKAEKAVVELVMRGWTITDIASEYEQRWESINSYFKRAVKKIVRTNNDRWADFHAPQQI